MLRKTPQNFGHLNEVIWFAPNSKYVGVQCNLPSSKYGHPVANSWPCEQRYDASLSQRCERAVRILKCKALVPPSPLVKDSFKRLAAHNAYDRGYTLCRTRKGGTYSHFRVFVQYPRNEEKLRSPKRVQADYCCRRAAASREPRRKNWLEGSLDGSNQMGLETCWKKLSTQLKSRMKEQMKEIKKKKRRKKCSWKKEAQQFGGAILKLLYFCIFLRVVHYMAKWK